MLDKDMRIYVAGHRGMVGSAIVRQLQSNDYAEILVRTRTELDLTSQNAVRDFFSSEKIDYVVLAAAKVGGIFANNEYPAEFIYENLMIECNVIHEAYRAGVADLLFLGSSCIYPKAAEQPMKEEALLSGSLEPTNEPYAIAKIAGIKFCESYNRQYGTDYRSVMPTNLYGPNDNYHGQNSHVIPALLKRFHEAKQEQASSVVVWGSGKVYREFLHVDDMASACLHVMRLPKDSYNAVTQERTSHLNVGAGEDISIREVASLVKEVVGFPGEIVFDVTKPDGTPKKLMDSHKLNSLGWEPKIPLKEGLEHAYREYSRTLPGPD